MFRTIAIPAALSAALTLVVVAVGVLTTDAPTDPTDQPAIVLGENG